MSRIYWDTMVFAYWLEDQRPASDRIEAIYLRMKERGDVLVASSFSVAELLVGPAKQGDEALAGVIRRFFRSGVVEVRNFDQDAAERFATIRAGLRISPADAIHLACAASAGVDLFLTNDSVLRKLTVPGISFIDGMETTALGS